MDLNDISTTNLTLQPITRPETSVLSELFGLIGIFKNHALQNCVFQFIFTFFSPAIFIFFVLLLFHNQWQKRLQIHRNRIRSTIHQY